MELGNLMFNDSNKNQIYECPTYIVALLYYLNSELCRVMWNRNQKEYNSPFFNTGNTFKNDVFEVKSYNWDEHNVQHYNFKYYVGKNANCKDIQISWYKRLGRDTTINEEYDTSIIINMFNDCLNSILKMDVDYKEDDN